MTNVLEFYVVLAGRGTAKIKVTLEKISENKQIIWFVYRCLNNIKFGT